MQIAVKLIKLFILSLFLVNNPTYANVCGSNVSKFLVPDYVCFDKLGGAVPYSYCRGSNDKLERKVISFVAACDEHDNCYGTKGNAKSYCDARFYRHLINDCNDEQKSLNLPAFKSCIKTAFLYNDIVRGQETRNTVWGDFQQIPFTGKSGCNAYIDGQKKAGIANPSCDGSNEVVSEAKPTSIGSQTQVNTNEATTSSKGGMINIDWPKELKVSCDSKKPAFTDIVISVNGLEQNKAYDLLLRGYDGGSRYIYPRRTSEPKILYEDAYAGHYVAEVWFDKGGIKNQKLIASKAFTIIRPEPELTAPVNVAESAPIKVTLSNVISPLKRNTMTLTVVPKYYPLENYAERTSRIDNCKPIEHTFRGLTSGQYEVRLIQRGFNGLILLANKSITVTGK